MYLRTRLNSGVAASEILFDAPHGEFWRSGSTRVFCPGVCRLTRTPNDPGTPNSAAGLRSCRVDQTTSMLEFKLSERMLPDYSFDPCFFLSKGEGGWHLQIPPGDVDTRVRGAFLSNAQFHAFHLSRCNQSTTLDQPIYCGKSGWQILGVRPSSSLSTVCEFLQFDIREPRCPQPECLAQCGDECWRGCRIGGDCAQ